MKTGGLDRGWIILKEYCYLEANLVGYSIDRSMQFCSVDNPGNGRRAGPRR
jgi:hypothetical protein